MFLPDPLNDKELVMKLDLQFNLSGKKFSGKLLVNLTQNQCKKRQ